VTTVQEGAFFGLYADRETLPEVDRLASEIDHAIDQLLELAPRPELPRTLVGV
jgi:hypothetical protein